MHNFSGGTSVV